MQESIPADAPISQPYWLRETPEIGHYRVADASLIGRPQNPPAFPIEQIFEVGGQKLTIPDEAVEAVADAAKKNSRRTLEIVAPVVLSFNFDVENFVPGAARPVEVQAVAVRPGVTGQLKLAPPPEWKNRAGVATVQHCRSR